MTRYRTWNRAIIRQRKANNPNSPLWPSIEARWNALVDHCRGVVAAYLSGKAMNRNERQACQEAVKLAEHVEAGEVVETALALYLMHKQAPHRFLSDDAFRHQLYRRLRGLADVNAGTWYAHTTNKMKRVYRDLPATSALVMGGDAGRNLRRCRSAAGPSRGRGRREAPP